MKSKKSKSKVPKSKLQPEEQHHEIELPPGPKRAVKSGKGWYQVWAVTPDNSPLGVHFDRLLCHLRKKDLQANGIEIPDDDPVKPQAPEAINPESSNHHHFQEAEQMVDKYLLLFDGCVQSDGNSLPFVKIDVPWPAGTMVHASVERPMPKSDSEMKKDE